MPSRGIRNNNPGNIDFNADNFARDPWMGEVGLEEHATPRFTRFEDPVYGIRAMAKILLTYQNKYNLDTVEKMISRWAPPSENNVHSYVHHVCKWMDCKPDEVIDLSDDRTKFQLMLAAMIKHENGDQPYKPSQINAALSLALTRPQVINIVTGSGGTAA